MSLPLLSNLPEPGVDLISSLGIKVACDPRLSGIKPASSVTLKSFTLSFNSHLYIKLCLCARVVLG